MNNYEKQYSFIINYCLKHGKEVISRNGKIKQITAAQIRANLNEGFPIVTGKKIFPKSCFIETEWMLNGLTNIQWLNSRGVKIWDQWADKNACNIGVTAAISAGIIAAFTPEPANPAAVATSTTLSVMASTITSMAVKVAVVGEMSEIITNAFLLIPYVSDSIDHTLLKNIISNCLAKSLDSAALWATPAGVGIAIGAAFAPVIADLICTKTCPEGFTKAFTG